MATSSIEISRLLHAWGDGDRAALDQLTPLVYAELHQIAHRHMRRQVAGQILQTTALVNEAYLRLVDVEGVRWQDRTHFFAVSAQMMRRILVDRARAQAYQKRGGGAERVSLLEEMLLTPERPAELLELDEALQALSEQDARKAQVVELRYFGGMSVEETSVVLDVSEQTVLRDWKLAKAWLAQWISHQKEAARRRVKS